MEPGAPDPDGKNFESQVLESLFGSEWVDPDDFSTVIDAEPAPSPKRGPEPGWKFLPPVPERLFLTAAGQFGLVYAEKDSTNHHYVAAALVDLGEPSLLAARRFSSAPSLTALRRYVIKAVQPLPRGRAGIPGSGKYARLVHEDLTSGFPYQDGNRFAGRVLSDLWIAKRCLPALVEACQSRHRFLKRNAVYVMASLAYSGEEEALAALREVAASREDPVAWFRAVRILVEARDPKVGPIIMKQLPGRDPVAAAFLLRSLGAMRTPKAESLLLKVSRAFDRDPDVQWAFLEAVASLRPDDADIRKRVDRLASRFQKMPGGKSAVLLDLARRANRDASLVQKADQSRKRSLGSKAHSILNRFSPAIRSPMAAYLASVAWPHMKDVVLDRKEMDSVRITAMTTGTYKEADWIDELSGDPEQPFALRAAAAFRLAMIDPKRSRKAALRLLRAYADGATGRTTSAQEHVVEGCLQLLGAGVSPEDLIRTLRRAVKAREQGLIKREGNYIQYLVALLVRRGEKVARPVLESLLADKDAIRRGTAAYGLAHFRSMKTLSLLESRHAFVRFCAAEALEKVSKRAIECDFLYGTSASRSKEVKRIRSWMGGTP